MTKSQALALMSALEGQKISADAIMRFDAAGNESWQVSLDSETVYTGAQLTQLTNYCTQNNLALSVIVQQMGVT